MGDCSSTFNIRKNYYMKKNRILSIYMSWVVNLGQSMHYIQAWKIFSTKSAEDVSILAYTVCLVVLLHWFAYGIIIKDKILIMAETLGIFGATLVIIGTIIYS